METSSKTGDQGPGPGRGGFVAAEDRKAAAGEERLLFRLGAELFSFPVSSVREIVDVRSITHPRGPSPRRS